MIVTRSRSLVRHLAALGAMTGLMALAACSGPSHQPSPPSTPSTTQPSTQPATQPATGPGVQQGSGGSSGSSAGLKPIIAGLIDRDGPPPSNYTGVVSNFVVAANWSDLQPQPDGPIVRNNAIDRGIAEARAMEAAHKGLIVGIKLRVYAGIDAPDWVKNLGGAPLPVFSPQSGVSGTVGRFWTPAFGAAWDQFQSKLAAIYDTVPEIREQVIARCTTVYDEPFVRQREGISRAEFVAAGYTVAADETCQRQEIQEAAAVWHHTRSVLTLNPFQPLTAKPGTTDEAFTQQMMAYCRKLMGPRCVLENNSIRSPLQGGAYASMYTEIKALGPPIAFQTATMSKVGDLTATLAWAVSEGATSVELPAGFNRLTPSTFTSFASGFVRQAQAQRLGS
jgi:hypothetical protein